MAIDTTFDIALELEVPPAHAEPRPATAAAERGLRSTVGQGVLALADQSAVSGVRFLTTVIVGRTCGPEELGIYSLGFTLLVVFSCALESLIFTPLTVYGSQLQGTARREYCGGVLGVAALVALVAAVGLGALALLMMGVGHPGLAPVLAVLTLAGPAILAWEFCRWFSLAHRRLDQAAALDLGVAVCQSGAVLGLAWMGMLSAVTAYFAIAAVCVINAGCWFLRSRSAFVLRRDQMLPALKRNWSLARWIFASRVIYPLTFPAILWIVAGVDDAEDVGQLTACMTVVLLFNPILLGINNFLFPRVVQSLLHGGRAELRRTVWKYGWTVAGGVALASVLMTVFGEQVIRLIYGNAYADHRATIMLLALVPLANIWTVIFCGGLCALERTDATFAASLAANVASVGVAAVLVPFWGISGAACGLLAGSIAGVLACGLAFQTATAPETAEEARIF